PPLRCLLHDETRWPGHGAVDQPVGHRGARGTLVGHLERHGRGDVPVHRSGPERTDAVTADAPIVFVVDDDRSVRDAISRLLDSVGLRAETFGTAHQFLDGARPDVPSCLVLDVRLPDLSGLELHRQLLRRRLALPTVFITGHGDVPMSAQAMTAGPVESLPKPS